MAPSGDTTVFRVKSIFTLKEAIAYQKMWDKNTTTGQPIRWVNAETGRPVSIGYTN